MQSLFDLYVSLLATPSRVFRRWQRVERRPAGGVEKRSDESLEVLDADATRIGNRYRGIGILIGILGVLIVLIELLSRLQDVFGRWQLEMAIVRFILMMVTLGLLGYSWKSQLHKKWIDRRIEAERKRYELLEQVIDEYARCQDSTSGDNGSADRPHFDEARKDLIHESMKNCEQQIAYNKHRALRYGGIKAFCDDAGWLVFALALLSTALSFFADHIWLLLFTGILPAILIAIHGINGFLGIGDLADEHTSMASNLTDIHGKLQKIRAAGSDELYPASAESPQDLLALAKDLHLLLVTRDNAWMNFARKMEVRAI